MRRFAPIRLLIRALPLVLAALGGCVNLQAIAPGTPAAEFEGKAGKPFRVWPEAGGGSTWEYPTGPEGDFTYMARMGANGRLIRVDQVLDWPFFNKLVPGMPMTEVEHILGRPWSKVTYERMNQTAWTWRWQEIIFKRCFDAYAGPDGKLIRTGMRDQEIGEHGLLRALPC